MRRLAAELGLRPSRALGQNFVVDPGTVTRIARLAGVGPGDVVLEVGPGLGSLTVALLATGATVVAVEVDERLAARLPATVATHPPGPETRAEPGGESGEPARLHVVVADAVRLDTADLAPAVEAAGGPPTRLVANLPYNVAVPVLLRVLDRIPTVASGVVMVQSEVADRLAAVPGTRAYGSPTVKLAWYAAVRRLGSVPPTVFWPVPRVDSGLLGVQRHPPPVAAPARDAVFACVEAAFAQRRKGLRSALAPLAGSAAAAEAALAAAGVPPLARGEQLTLAEFARLAAELPDRASG